MKKFIKLLIVIITSIFILTGCDITSTNGETKKLDTPYLEYGTNSIIWDSITNADEYIIYVDDVYLTKTNHAYFDDFELSGKTGMLYIIASGDKSRFENSDISIIIYLADLAKVKSSYESKFLMINDTHGAFVDNQYPGVERLASLIKQLGDEYIKIANGDILQGSYISNILCGYPMIDALNNMNFNAYVIGNHEFDWGLDKIAEYKDGNEIVDARMQCFQNSLMKRGLYKSEYTKFGDYYAKYGYELLKELHKEGNMPTALFVANDSMAAGSYRAAYELGLSIPDDISIVGFNDIPTAKYMVPPLTTERLYMEFMGEYAVKLLEERIVFGREICVRVTIPTKLYVRDSVKNLK